MDLFRLWRLRRTALPLHRWRAGGRHGLARLARAALIAAWMTATLGAPPARAAVPRAAPAASAAAGGSARQVLHETRTAGAEPVARPAALSAWQRWGERLLALGVGAGVGGLLLRLGRDGDGHDNAHETRASRSDAG